MMVSNWNSVALVTGCFGLGLIWWTASSAGVLPPGLLSSPFPGFALMGLAFSVGVGGVVVPARARAEAEGARLVREAAVIYYPEDLLEVDLLEVEVHAPAFVEGSPIGWAGVGSEAQSGRAAEVGSSQLFAEFDDPMSFDGDPEMSPDSLAGINLEVLMDHKPFNTPAPWTISAQIERLQRVIEEDESRHKELLAKAISSRSF